MGKIRIVPAILTDDSVALKTMAYMIKDVADWVQVDIMDGEFVPSHSINWQEVKATQMPFEWEAHLMVMEPGDFISGFKSAGAQRIIFHFEATHDPTGVITAAREQGVGIGMAINPETTVTQVAGLLPLLDSVLLLSVHPGFYGAEYIPEVLDKVGQLRTLVPDISISIDGGIKEDNILEVAASGVNDICVGSGIFRADDPAAAYLKFQGILDAASL
ncbi:MAG: ribulose-phosphate 3-epimerase [Dehalogenimonas sp.]|uniref:Ribulose-phosphate 3-epimerase n=1 Tax=Candidatus Dehalogenimonas loeffleri TaxID=3127115 RepID=A0ABZ2J7K1_9CHLR|nr:ribulose-phosphate 3-epimerase [Dehalogenimonas sp.]